MYFRMGKRRCRAEAFRKAVSSCATAAQLLGRTCCPCPPSWRARLACHCCSGPVGASLTLFRDDAHRLRRCHSAQRSYQRILAVCLNCRRIPYTSLGQNCSGNAQLDRSASLGSMWGLEGFTLRGGLFQRTALRRPLPRLRLTVFLTKAATIWRCPIGHGA